MKLAYSCKKSLARRPTKAPTRFEPGNNLGLYDLLLETFGGGAEEDACARTAPPLRYIFFCVLSADSQSGGSDGGG